VSGQDGDGVSVEDMEASPSWHLKAVAIIAACLLVGYALAVNLVLK
jgi:hypothetical protein